MYKTKYLKYKNKYLTLKDQYGGSKLLLEQTPTLYRILRSDNISLVGPTENKMTNDSIPIQMIKDKKFRIYDVIFKKYPLEQPIIRYKSQLLKTPDEWKSDITITSIIINNMVMIDKMDQRRVLIYCHYKKDGEDPKCDFDEKKLTNHWWGTSESEYKEKNLTIFNHLMNAIPYEFRLTGKTICDTLDSDDRTQPTLHGNGFDINFISTLHKYDLVIVPDCGGEWSTLQDPYFNKTPDEINLMPSIDKDRTRFKKICEDIATLLTPNGILIFSKFLSYSTKPFLLEELINNFHYIFPKKHCFTIQIGKEYYVIVINKQIV